MAEPAHTRVTYAEYLAIERETRTRHEYLDGEIHAMAGGSPRHSAIKTNLAGIFYGALDGTPCRPYDADLKIRVLETGLATYPDLAVVCGPLELDPEDRNAVTNPVVLVEALSPSTEAWHRGEKFAHYRRIPSLRHFLLVDVLRARVEHYTRGEGAWILTVHGLGDRVQLEAIGCAIDVDRVFRNLPED